MISSSVFAVLPVTIWKWKITFAHCQWEWQVAHTEISRWIVNNEYFKYCIHCSMLEKLWYLIDFSINSIVRLLVVFPLFPFSPLFCYRIPNFEFPFTQFSISCVQVFLCTILWFLYSCITFAFSIANNHSNIHLFGILDSFWIDRAMDQPLDRFISDSI